MSWHDPSALQLLYLARYVHRDVSAGNILCYEETQGKLSDLEYAKPFRSIDEHRKDAKTGTLGFMSIEVQAWEYQFHLSQEVPLPGIPFFHNFQHDLESLFWLFVWLVSHRILETVLPLTAQWDLVYLRQQADRYFSLLSSDPPFHRFTFILRPGTSLERGLSTVAQGHGLMLFVVDQLYRAKRDIRGNYSLLEGGDLVRLEDPESFSTIYNGIRDIFRALKEHVDAQSQSSQTLKSLTAYLYEQAPAAPSST
ncbi:hypothetical protein FISHEDRAFT_78162 [Fistulina hepatica ATCC 64428]|nr:hypothetical protein FISHEDRAFT_78162 [Fistulina hepatica ATCC 64428]